MGDGQVTECGICGCPDLRIILDMGAQPLAEQASARYPLTLVRCEQCTLIQLDHIVDQATVFPPDHPYSTGNTRVLREHFAALAAELEATVIAPGGLVVDIGCNDGTFLAAFSDRVKRFGVEPTGQAFKCADKSIPVWQDFFTTKVARGIRDLRGPAQVVTACNVLAHVPDPHDFLDGVVDLLADDGVFITENHDVRSITEGLQIDTIYHEHLRYYSSASLAYLLALHGLDVTSVQQIPTHGGSLRVAARKRTGNLSNRAYDVAGRLRRLLGNLLDAETASVYGVGAATRATPLIHFAGIASQITCVCEVGSSDKIGMLMPGTAIPVVDEARLIEDQPEYALLFSWHLADSIIPKLRQMGYKGQFIIPLPEPRITDR